MPKTKTATASMRLPSISDTRRPKRSATAPVGTSASTMRRKNGVSSSVICVRERPRLFCR
jgi:hypothetical protein